MVEGPLDPVASLLFLHLTHACVTGSGLTELGGGGALDSSRPSTKASMLGVGQRA